MLGFLPTRAYRPRTPGATTFLSPLSGTFNYGWDSFEFGSATAHQQYDVTPDDERFIMIRQVSEVAADARLIWVQNFFEELKRVVPN